MFQWIVFPRPEGIRCLVICNHGKTVSRKRNGQILHRSFQSPFPGGHRRSCDPSSLTVLDCVFQSYTIDTFFIIDVLLWNGMNFVDQDVDFRFAWIRDRSRELDPVASGSHFSFVEPRFPCSNFDVIAQCYNHFEDDTKFGFRQDGILFYHRKGIYEMGHSPLTLIWKDSFCCPYFVDTDGVSISSTLIASCRIHPDRSVRTLDDIIIGSFAEQICGSDPLRFCNSHGLAKFSIPHLKEIEGRPMVDHLTYLGKCSEARRYPDSWSKIRFQFDARLGRTISVADFQQFFLGKRESIMDYH